MAQKNSLLTDIQREFLRMSEEEREETYTKQQRSYYRQNIRKRVESGITDFSLLFDEWSEDEREAVFEAASEEFETGLADMFALVYLERFLGGRFKNLLLRGVNRAEQRLAGSDLIRVRTNFEVEYVSEIRFERAIEKFEQGNLRDLTDDEAQALIYLIFRSNSLTDDDFEDMHTEFREDLQQIRDKIADAEREGRRNRREKQR